MQHSFLDLIVLYNIFKYREARENKLKTFKFMKLELMEIRPINKSFKRIKEVYCGNYKDASAKLGRLKKTPIQEIEEISFGEMNEKNFKQITSQLLNYKIHKLDISDDECSLSISNEILENISKINPQKLHQFILNI